MAVDLKHRTYINAGRMLVVILLCLPALTFSQPNGPGSIEYLKFCNGLCGFTLGSDISGLPQDKLAFMDGDDKFDADSCLKFEYRDYDLFKMANGLRLELIGLRSYKNKVVNIYLFFKRADGYKVLSNFLTAYGPFTSKPDDYADIYNWNSSLLTLSLKYELQVDLGVAILTCKSLANQIEVMKERAKARRELEELAAQYGTFVKQTFGDTETLLPGIPLR